MSNSQDSFGFQTEYEYDQKGLSIPPQRCKHKESNIYGINNISIILVGKCNDSR